MVTEAMKEKGHCMLVYPANGAIGYTICRDMLQTEKKEECRELLAVCCAGEGKYYDKLKELGKHVKIIVLDQATHMDNWKKHLKDHRVDCMMLCVDPSASRHHERQGQTQDEAAQCMAKSMENAVEMTSHLHTRCLCIGTAMNSNDSKYRIFHHIYSAIENAARKHYKGDCATVFSNLMFECLMLNRQEIQQDKRMSWPVSPNAESAPLSMCDYACCCIGAMYHMLKEIAPEAAKGRHNKYHVTGQNMMSPQSMMDMMSKDLNTSIKFNQVDQSEWKKMMQDHISGMEVCCFMEVFQMMEDGKLRKTTDDCKKLTGRSPMHFDKWLRDHENDFAPK